MKHTTAVAQCRNWSVLMAVTQISLMAVNLLINSSNASDADCAQACHCALSAAAVCVQCSGNGPTFKGQCQHVMQSLMKLNVTLAAGKYKAPIWRGRPQRHPAYSAQPRTALPLINTSLHLQLTRGTTSNARCPCCALHGVTCLKHVPTAGALCRCPPGAPEPGLYWSITHASCIRFSFPLF